MNLANVLHYSLRWLYKSVAIILVMVAVIISCLRLFLPYAENYRTELQDYINTTYQTNIVIGSFNTGWGNKGPTLLVNNVSLINAQGLAIFIGNLEVDIDFWRSLQLQQLVTTNFTIDQAKIYLQPEKFETEKNTGNKVLLAQLSELFLTQIPRFSVHNSEVNVALAGTTQHLSIAQLAWMNKGERHRGQGDVIVNGLSSNKLQLLIDLYGDKHANLKGQAYFKANNIDVAPWLNDFIVIDEHTESTINFESWLNVEHGNAKKLIVKFGENSITWQKDNINDQLTINDGYFVVEASDNYDYLGFYSSPIHWQVGTHEEQTLTFNAHFAYGNFSGFVNELDIESAVALNPLFFEEGHVKSAIESVAALGSLNNIHFQYQNGLRLVTNFDNIAIDYHNNVPGIKNLSGQLAYYRNKAWLQMNANRGVLDFGPHFKRPIPYNTLNAEAILTFQQGVFAQVNSFALNSDEAEVTAKVFVDVPAEGQAGMSLLAYINNGQGAAAKHYYPHLLMGDNLVNYLDRAITDGQLTDAEVIFEGKFADFPFTEKPGVFNVNAKLQNSNFVFDANWPSIENLNATLDFTNNSMLITAHSGSLSGLEVKNVTVAIDDLSHDQLLVVAAKFEDQKPEHVAALMNASPLQNSVGAVLNTAVFNGKLVGNFSLQLPLSDEDKRESVVQGKIKFDNNGLQLSAPEMTFANLYGELLFENEKITVDELRANWRGMPLTFEVIADNYSNYYRTDINFTSRWAKELWALELPEPLQKYVDGELNWQGELTLTNPHVGDFYYQLNIVSQLDNNVFHLPAPYQKAKQQPANFVAEARGTSDLTTIQASLDEHLSFFGELSHQSQQFQRAHLYLGTDDMMLPQKGFHITTELEHADVSQWQPFISDILAALPEGDGSGDGVFPAPDKIRGEVATVSLFDKQFSSLSFDVIDKKNWWQLELNAKELNSVIKFYPDWLAQGVDINIEFLKLAAAPSEDVFAGLTHDINDDEVNHEALEKTDKTLQVKVDKTPPEQIEKERPVEINHDENKVIFASIPPIVFQCDSCQIGHFDFGKVSFNIARENKQLVVLKNFHAKRSGMEAKLAGQWLMAEDFSRSQLEGNINVKKIQSEMERLGFESIIRDSGADMNFDLNWLGGFQDFSLANLNGKIHSRLDDGYLADVSDSARIFSILSLQSLVRKLTLDFRDIFSDGMFYSEIKGDALIEKGIIYTDNMKMKGSAGDLWVKGNTNMATGMLDYRMSYKPNLTSSLPVLGWIATLNPVAVIAGVAIDEVITSNVVSEFTFELTGTIDEPDLKEVDRKSKNISVGRSTPPKEVDDSVAPDKGAGLKNTPLKQYSPLYEHKEVEKKDG